MIIVINNILCSIFCQAENNFLKFHLLTLHQHAGHDILRMILYSFLKKPLIFCILTVGVFVCSQCAERPEVTVMHQELTVTLDLKRHEVRGTSSFTLSGNQHHTIVFSLSSRSRVEKVTINGRDSAFRFGQSRLSVSLPEDETAVVTIAYAAVFDDPMPERTFNTEDPSFGVQATIREEGVYLGGGSGWYPTAPVPPRGMTVRVNAPEGMKAVTEGRFVESGDREGQSHSLWGIQRPMAPLSLSAGYYRINESRIGSIALYTFLSPKNAHLSDTYLKAIREYIALYQEMLGPYPYEKFAVVENFLPTGYGFPSYTLLGGEVIRLPFILQTSLGHEILHSWFGAGVMVDYRRGNWSEGLVTYLADYYYEERKSPDAAREYRMQILSDYATLVSEQRAFPLIAFSGRSDPASRAIGYGKASMVFHMVRQRLGDEAFYQALRDFYRDHLFRYASWDDLIASFERAGGDEIRAFLSRWIEADDAPIFSVEGLTCGASGIKGMVKQIGEKLPVHLPLRIENGNGGTWVSKSIDLQKEQTPFSLTLDQPPGSLVLDPDYHVFRRLAALEIPHTVNRIKGSRDLLVVRSRSYKGTEETIAVFLIGIGQSKAVIIGEEEFDPSRTEGQDLLFFGLPADKRIYSALPHDIVVADSSFSIEGATFHNPGDALFIACANPRNGAKTVGIFHPLSRTAAEDTAHRITRYGRYSHLAFSEGQNMKKGVSYPYEKRYPCSQQ